MNNRKLYEVIGYTYDADLHCLKCTRKRFPQSRKKIDEYYGYEGNDLDGNEIHPVFLGDEHDTPPVCGDCFKVLD